MSKKGVMLWAMRNRRARRLVVRGLTNRRVRKLACGGARLPA